MPDYKAMYYKLFNTYADIIEILQKAHQEVEEMYINSEDDDEEETED